MMSDNERDHHFTSASPTDMAPAHGEKAHRRAAAWQDEESGSEAYREFRGADALQEGDLRHRPASGETPTAHLSPAWRKQLPAARVVWNVISDDALREADGRTELLIELVRQHYALSYSEARRQVRRFFMTHKP